MQKMSISNLVETKKTPNNQRSEIGTQFIDENICFCFNLNLNEKMQNVNEQLTWLTV